MAKNGDEQKVVKYLAKIDIFLFPLMKQQKDIFLSDHLGHGADGSEVARSQCRQGVDIEIGLPVALVGNDIARHVEQKDTMNTHVHEVDPQDAVDTFQLFRPQCVIQLFTPCERVFAI